MTISSPERRMAMIAQLAVAAAVYAIDKPYSYRVPEGMQE